jgi:hypothetical protein
LIKASTTPKRANGWRGFKDKGLGFLGKNNFNIIIVGS